MVMNKREKTEFEAMQARIAELELQVKGQAVAEQSEPPKPFVWDYDSYAMFTQEYSAYIWDGQTYVAQSIQANPVVTGYTYFVYPSSTRGNWDIRTWKVWSTGVTHYSNPELKSGTRGSGILYKTKKEALLAARYEVIRRSTKMMEKAIATIDKQLAEIEQP